MKLTLFLGIILGTLPSSIGWPRYGRPHPLYGNQAGGGMLGQAVLLGIDLNEIHSFQSTSGNDLGLQLPDLVNRGFPLNARERKKAVHDITALDALGVIEVPEDSGFLATNPQAAQAPDPPDSPGQKQTKKKGKGKANTKKQAAILTGQPKATNSTRINNTQQWTNVSARKGVLPTKTAVVHNLGTLAAGNSSQAGGIAVGPHKKAGKKRNKQRKGNVGADPGEGIRAEQVGGRRRGWRGGGRGEEGAPGEA